MTKTADAFGCCKCGAVIWVSGEFDIDESGNADIEWECEVCGMLVSLHTEDKGDFYE